MTAIKSKGAVLVGTAFVPVEKDRDLVEAIRRIVRKAAESGLAA
jgi:hypothetical protein